MLALWRTLTALTFVLVAASAAGADDGSRFAAIWVKEDGPGWVARHGLTGQQYQAEFDKWTGQGYCPSQVSGYSVGGQARYAALFEKANCGQFVARHGLSASKYQQEFDKWTGEGYRLKFVDGYGVGNQARFAAVWVKSGGGASVARHGLNAQQYQAQFDKWTGEGYCLSHVGGYAENGASRYTALFEKKNCPAYVARHGLTAAQYQAEFDKWTGQGYRLVSVDGHVAGGKAVYSAIWHKGSGAAYVARHGMTADQYQKEFDKWAGQGYRLRQVSAF